MVLCCVASGRAESVRLMLKDQCKEWEDIPVPGPEWPTVKQSCVSNQQSKDKSFE